MNSILSFSSLLYTTKNQQPPQYPPPPLPQPQQLIGPPPRDLIPKEITLDNPSPNTNPLAIIINGMFSRCDGVEFFLREFEEEEEDWEK